MAVGLHHVSGPTLVDLRRRMEAVQAAQFRVALAQNLGEEARTQVANGFRGERDPYGQPWAPLKRRKGKILRDTGRMAASVAVSQVGAGFQLEITADYAPNHQYGTKPHKVAARAAKQNARGRFVKKSRTGYLLRIKEHENPGIPQRQMVPMAQTGGLGPIWAGAFDKVTTKMLRDTFGKR